MPTKIIWLLRFDTNDAAQWALALNVHRYTESVSNNRCTRGFFLVNAFKSWVEQFVLAETEGQEQNRDVQSTNLQFLLSEWKTNISVAMKLDSRESSSSLSITRFVWLSNVDGFFCVSKTNQFEIWFWRRKSICLNIARPIVFCCVFCLCTFSKLTRCLSNAESGWNRIWRDWSRANPLRTGFVASCAFWYCSGWWIQHPEAFEQGWLVSGSL